MINCFLPVGVLSVLSIVCATVYADELKPPDLVALDDAFIQLSHEAYERFAQHQPFEGDRVDELMVQVQGRLSERDHVNAIRLIVAATEALVARGSADAVLSAVRLLLSQNERLTAQRVFEGAGNRLDSATHALLSYEFAKYYFTRQQWSACLEHLSGAFKHLSGGNLNHALLIAGIASQRLTQHRDAIERYQQIAPESGYYFHAQLNIAIAYIRQGWWSDARLVINELLGDPQFHTASELMNRSYVILGYAMLQREYYREARQALRSVELDSMYANRALLGIALAATGQADFDGALTLLAELKRRGDAELVVDEAYFLVPYVLSQNEQYAVALESYHHAIEYYERRLQEVDSAVADIQQGGGPIQWMVHLDSANHNTAILTQNSQALLALMKAASSAELASLGGSLQQLYDDYRAAMRAVVEYDFLQTRRYLESYISQSRYGIARIYDENLLDTD